MAKTKKNNRKNNKNKQKFFLILLPLLAIVFSCFVIYKGIENYIKTSQYFKVKSFEFDGLNEDAVLLRIKDENLGKNIFLVDAKGVSRQIQMSFPEVNSVIVKRVLPSRLFISAKMRVPVAAVKRGCFYYFDKDGVVLSDKCDSEDSDLPLIVGLENSLKKVNVGSRYSHPLLKKALLLAQALKDSEDTISAVSFSGQKLFVSKINAVSSKDLSFFINGSVEIKIGPDSLDEKIRLIPAILRSLSDELSYVSYIDLRPSEPVVSYNKNYRGVKK